MPAIYALINPLNKNVFYIGYARDAKNRLKHHLKPSRLQKSIQKNHYIKDEILAYGATPDLIILEECDATNWREREQFWINLYKSKGHQLCNESKGGEGPHGFRLK